MRQAKLRTKPALLAVGNPILGLMARWPRRLKADIAKKGIMFFSSIDQAQLAAEAGIKLRPSTLLIFGDPLLGGQFLTSDPDAGLDWPDPE